LIALRNAGAAILLVSSDLQELRSLSDRILVMVRGSSAACFSDLSDVTDEVLGRYMLGLSRMDDAERRRNSLEDEPD
jgi:simple sugar transport system ATP-binding protein